MKLHLLDLLIEICETCCMRGGLQMLIENLLKIIYSLFFSLVQSNKRIDIKYFLH